MQNPLKKDFIWDKVEWGNPVKISRIALESTEEDFFYELILNDLTENPDSYTEEEILDILYYESHLQK